MAQLTLDHPARLGLAIAILGGVLAVAAVLVPLTSPAVLAVAGPAVLFAALHAGLGPQRNWKVTGGCLVPAAAVAQWILPSYPAFGYLLIGALAGGAAGAGLRDRVTRLSVGLGVTLGTLVGVFAAFSIAGSSYLAALMPGAVLQGLGGAIAGALIGLGTLPRHLPLERDPVEVLYEEVRLLPGAEMRDYSERAMKLYRQIRRTLAEGVVPAHGEGAARFRDDLAHLMTATFGLAKRWREIEAFLDHADARTTRARLEANETKLAGLTDAYARRQYEQVSESLKRRLGQLDEMQGGKERVIGSLSYYFTTLEDMHLSLMRLKATDAQSASLEMNALADRIRGLNDEIDATARSIESLDFEAGAASVPRLAK